MVSVNVSDEKGVPKHEVGEARLIAEHGIQGDAHAGPWHRQVSLLAEESIDRMRAMGLTGLTHGAFGENINTSGLYLSKLPVGTWLRFGGFGGPILVVTQIGKDCHNDGCAIKKATGQCVMPTDGVFATVLQGGLIRAGDEIEIAEEDSDGHPAYVRGVWE